MRRIVKTAEFEDGEGGLYRPLYRVGIEEMKVIYELEKEELEQAVVDWLHSAHGVNAENGILSFIAEHDGEKRSRPDILLTYTPVLEVDKK